MLRGSSSIKSSAKWGVDLSDRDGTVEGAAIGVGRIDPGRAGTVPHSYPDATAASNTSMSMPRFMPSLIG